jgi:hypothetical protein
MIVRIQKRLFPRVSDRWLRLQGCGLVAVGVGLLAVWDPLTHPGPRMCPLRETVGLPCPLCGMTRGVSLCLHGHPAEASVFNPLAAPVLIVALVLAVKWAVEFGSGRCFDVLVPPWLGRRLWMLGYAIVLMNWAYLLVYRREDSFDSTLLGRLWALFGS